MLISCKCLNFIASSNSDNSELEQDSQVASTGTGAATAAAAPTADGLSVNTATPPPPGNLIAASLMRVFLQKYSRNFYFYSQCMDFFKQSIGPIPDFAINAINQRDLIYSLTLEISQAQSLQSWQLSICINCNAALCAKRLNSVGTPTGATAPQYLINGSLLTSSEEIMHRRADKSFSDTFGLLIMDHPKLEQTAQNGNVANNTLPITPTSSMPPLDTKQQRLRQLQQNLQQRLKREIAETDERIQRYTEQQFALLKSFREKAEQEYKLLARLIQHLPEQAGDMLDRTPTALEVSAGAINFAYTGRRRNTIGSRRELNASGIGGGAFMPIPSAMNKTTTTTAARNLNTQITTDVVGNATTNNNNNNGATTIIANAANNRKLSNFDTPPATPEATPMSVGNSPTFQQQQTQQQQQQSPIQLQPQSFGTGLRLVGTVSFQQQFPTPTMEMSDDCLFEMEGLDTVASDGLRLNPLLHQQQQQQQQSFMPLQQQLQRSHSMNQHENVMSDLEESDGAEEAEDAIDLDLDDSMPIPMNTSSNRRPSASQLLNFAKSLPIEIANSPMATKRTTLMTEVEEDELDTNVDIAASIKAIAKSVHGEAVFGDLPRPRLRSQI